MPETEITKRNLFAADWKTVLALALGGGFLYWVLKPSSDKQEHKEEHEQSETQSGKKFTAAFSDTFGLKYIKLKGFKTVNDYLIKVNSSTAQLEAKAKAIADAKGTFNDNEESLYNIFRSLKNIVVCSIVTKIFYLKYKTDLNTFLSDFLSSEEMGKIADIIETKNFA